MCGLAMTYTFVSRVQYKDTLNRRDESGILSSVWIYVMRQISNEFDHRTCLPTVQRKNLG